MIFGTATTAACLLTLFGLSTALPSPSNTFEKRAAVSGLAIFAYGSDINGLPVFYSDGKIRGLYHRNIKTETDTSIQEKHLLETRLLQDLPSRSM